MSRKPKNNHYHYAEQFTDRARRARRGALVLPKRFVLLALMMVVIFAVITTTFSFSDTESAERGSIVVRVRNTKVAQDYVATGMDKDDAYAMTGADADLVATGAYTALSRLYFNNTNTGYSTVYCVIGKGDYARSYAMTNTGYHNIWYLDIDGWTDRTKMFFANHGDSPNGQNYSIDAQYGWNTTGSTRTALITCANNDGGSCFIPSGNNSSSCTRQTLFVVAGDFASNGWDDCTDLMTYSSSQWTKTYTNVSAGDYHLAVVAFYRDWNPAYRWAAKGTGTNVTLSNANDADQNINVKVPYDCSSVTITLTSAKKVNVSATYSSHTVSRTAPTSGTGTLQLSSDNSTFGNSNLTITPPNHYYVKATPATGYKIKTLTIGGSTISDAAGSTTAYTYDGTMGNSDVACSVVFEHLTYKIKYYKGDGSPVTGSITGTVSDGSKTYGTAYSITSSTYTRTGYTQKGWATTKNYTKTSSTSGGTTYYAFNASYTVNAALNLYPVWELNAPKNSAETGKPTITGGQILVGESHDLSPSENSCPADAQRSYSYTITRGGSDATSYASIGTDPTDATTYHKFTTNEPGTYKVTWTVTDTNSTNSFGTPNTWGVINTNGQAAVTTDEVEITVKPVSPNIHWTIYGTTGTDATHDGTSEHPFMIMLGNQYYCTVNLTNAISGYTYTWSTDADFSTTLASGVDLTTITFNGDYELISSDPTDPNYDPSTAELASDPETTPSFIVYCQASYNGVTNDSGASACYYFIQPLVEEFKYIPFQKIFNLSDNSVSLSAKYNLDNATGYTTVLKFSNDNNTYVDAQTATEVFMESYEDAIRQYMYPSGPKFFYMAISGTANGVAVSTASPKIHTTVGTSEKVATRPLYFKNDVSGMDLKNFQVMCYYIDGSGSLGYQAAQDINKGDGNTNNDGLRYRVILPADATHVCFGILNVDPKQAELHYYGSPTLSVSGGEYIINGLDAPIYKGFTNIVTLSDSTRIVTANSKTDTNLTISDGAFTRWNVTCTSGVYS